VDGEHRLRAFIEVFPDEVEVMCAIMKGPHGGYLTLKEAIVSTIAYNFQHGEENPIKMANALRMALDSGMLVEDIEDLTGMKRNRVEAFLDFQELPQSGEGFLAFDPAMSGERKEDPIIMAFAVYPEDRVIIERALSAQDKHLGPEVDISEVKGKQLLIICQKILGEFKEEHP